MLFEIIEQVSDDVNDPYHYPTIRVLVSPFGFSHPDFPPDRRLARTQRTIHGGCTWALK